MELIFSLGVGIVVADIRSSCLWWGTVVGSTGLGYILILLTLAFEVRLGIGVCIAWTKGIVVVSEELSGIPKVI
jgi:hypothetical protein